MQELRLRTFLESLDASELERVEERVDLADVAARLEGNARAVWFTQLGLAGNVTGSRSRLARAFGVSQDQLLHEVLRRVQTKGDVVEVREAPVQEVVERDPDLTALPVHLQHGLDGAPYISASVDVTRDPASGLTNVGMRRLMLRGRREAGVDLNAPSDLRAIYQAHAARRERLPIAFPGTSSRWSRLCAARRCRSSSA
jgi:UbiD family decarboxylase